MNIKTERKPGHRPDIDAGPMALVCAVIQAGVEDAMKGDPTARKWLDSGDFDHWCAWADLDPEYMRRRIVPMLPKSKPEILTHCRLTLADIERIVQMRRRGMVWRDIGLTFKTSYPYIQHELRRVGIDPTTLQAEMETAG